jgi:hypothetical protein
MTTASAIEFGRPAAIALALLARRSARFGVHLGPRFSRALYRGVFCVRGDKDQGVDHGLLIVTIGRGDPWQPKSERHRSIAFDGAPARLEGAGSVPSRTPPKWV